MKTIGMGRWAVTVVLFFSVALLAACEQKDSPGGKQEEDKLENESASKAREESKPAAAKKSTRNESAGSRNEWSRIDPESLSSDDKEKLQRAKEATKKLGGTLMGELGKAVGEGDFAHGIEVCNIRAPEIRGRIVDEDERVEIGRTSFKLRNSDNTPPDWAKPYVDQRMAEEVVLKGPQDQLGLLAPIRLKEFCTNCHGTKEQIPDDVEQMLAQKYPNDRATGFAAGDLRGWFWVESR